MSIAVNSKPGTISMRGSSDGTSMAIDPWTPEAIPDKARSILNGRVVYVLFQLLIATMLFVVIVLVGVMVGRRDSSVTNAVRHLFVRVDSERLPLLPANYPRTAPDLVIILGDAWAAGLGADDIADDSWWAQLRTRWLADVTFARATNATARAADVGALATRLVLPSSLQGLRVAVVVQCGWNDIVGAQESGALEWLDVRTLAEQVTSAVRTLVHQTLFQRASSVAVYVLDYSDASAGTGFTDLTCESPLDSIYNHAGAVDLHLRALNMFSQALLGASHAEGFAFVPLRATLAAVGSPESMHSTARLNHRPVGVDGKHLPESPPPAAFTRQCGLMSESGQQFQADLVAAHLLNRPYFIVS